MSNTTDDVLDAADITWSGSMATAFAFTTNITVTFNTGGPPLVSGPMGAITDEVRVPDYVEPLIAYRAWLWNGEHLRSTYINLVWEKDTIYQAACMGTSPHKYCGFQEVGGELSPHKIGVCGFYSLKSDDPITIANCIGVTADNLVIGTIEIWGKIVEHSFGYRSEYARIRDIIWAGEYTRYTL